MITMVGHCEPQLKLNKQQTLDPSFIKVYGVMTCYIISTDVPESGDNVGVLPMTLYLIPSFHPLTSEAR